MIYICPRCRCGFTLPVGDYLIERNKVCFECKTKADFFIVEMPDSLYNRDNRGNQKKVYTNIYEG